MSEMTHPRIRYLESSLKKALQFSPIVGVLGQRQTGKTTLLAKFSNTYATLDLRQELELATQDPLSYLSERKPPFAIDECQLCPALFSGLKEWVRRHPQRGQFLLSGSVRFSSRKQVKESLTGRIALLELLPFTLSECHSKIFLNPADTKSYSTPPRFTEKEFEHFLLSGGLPGICFRRNQKLMNQGFEDQVSTLLDRDLRLLLDTKLPFSSLRNLLIELARQSGSPLDISSLSRITRISRPTVRKLMSAFESMFLLRILPTEGGIRAPIILFEDVGMMNYLTQTRLSKSIQNLNGFYQCVRAPFQYSFDKNFRFFQYQTRGGAYLPLALQTSEHTIGWIFSTLSEIDQSVLRSANSFLKNYPDARVYILGPKLEFNRLTPRISSAPWLAGL